MPDRCVVGDPTTRSIKKDAVKGARSAVGGAKRAIVPPTTTRIDPEAGGAATLNDSNNGPMAHQKRKRS